MTGTWPHTRGGAPSSAAATARPGRAAVPLALLALLQCLRLLVLDAAPAAAQAARLPVVVVDTVDGDTVKVRLPSGEVETLRLIGLDTPESVDPRRPVECFGRVASARMRELLPAGLEVQLEADPTQGDRDRYGRLLRYVILPSGWNAAEVMLLEGFGNEYTYRVPYRYQEAFKAAEQAAREAERGLWAPTACGADAPRAPEARSAPAPAVPPGAAGRAGVESTRVADVAGAAPCRPGQIKGNRNSGVYHLPGGAAYARTAANVQCFDTEAEAQAAGYRRAGR